MYMVSYVYTIHILGPDWLHQHIVLFNGLLTFLAFHKHRDNCV